MKIAVEASTLTISNKTGVQHYVKNLIEALLKIDHTNNYSLVYINPFFHPAVDLGVSAPNAHTRRIAFFSNTLYKVFLRLPFGPGVDLLAGIKPDIFLFPNFARWHLFWTKRSVVVIHDLAFTDYPGLLKRSRHTLFLKWIVPRSIKLSSLVVAVSEFTKKRLIEEYHVAPEKVIVVEPAIDKDFYHKAAAEDTARTKQKYRIDKPYILFLGTIEPRKNLKGVAQAYLNLSEELKSKYQLVIAGAKGWKDSDVFEVINSAPSGSIVVTGYVDQEDMPALYSGASVFVWPSLYEGWGMPIVEAMACGTPVITAANSSLIEAGGTAAAYVDPLSIERISGKIEEILTNPAEADRMRVAGFEHVKNFSWEKSAQKLLEGFESLNN